jgi:hypothetical protein
VQPLLITSYIRRQNLERDVAIKLSVAREINFAHAALAYLRADFITAEFCAGC